MREPELNRRKSSRFNLQLPASISVQKDSQIECIYLFTSNICSEGAFFKTELTLPIGTEVVLELMLHPINKMYDNYKRGQVTVTGKVIRKGDHGMAILFNSDYQISSLFLN